MPYAAYGLVAMLLISSYLLVAELPLFALKFKHWGWQGNEVKYLFLLTSLLLLLLLGVKGITVVIGWYVVLSVVTRSKQK
jgi:CDP-diacylglycerol--serine O-phosphatidyltransferase